jgi:hypothetical protein
MVNPEPVEVISDYGCGRTFKGKACRTAMQLEVDYPEGWF